MGSRWGAWPSSPSNSEQHPGWRRMGRSQVHQPLGLLYVRGAETPQEGAQGVVGPLEGRRALSVLRTKCRPPGGHWEDGHRQQQRLAEAAPKPHFREEASSSLMGSRNPTWTTWAEGGAGTGDTAGAVSGKVVSHVGQRGAGLSCLPRTPACLLSRELLQPALVLCAPGQIGGASCAEGGASTGWGPRGRVWTSPEHWGPRPGHPSARLALPMWRPFTPVLGSAACPCDHGCTFLSWPPDGSLRPCSLTQPPCWRPEMGSRTRSLRDCIGKRLSAVGDPWSLAEVSADRGFPGRPAGHMHCSQGCHAAFGECCGPGGDDLQYAERLGGSRWQSGVANRERRRDHGN